MMTTTQLEIDVRKTSSSRLKEVNWDKLEFGKHAGDHMLIAEYYDGKWQDARIVPYDSLQLSPFTLALHYGQSVFEGMKAFRQVDGRVSIFRTEDHHARFNRSLERMAMPKVPKELFLEGLHKLIAIDKEWVPKKRGEALYIRPFMFASEARLGVKISDRFLFLVITSPVGMYYPNPVSVKVEKEFVRAVAGGTGFAKCSGNYGGAFYPTELARQEGYDQVIWTDACDHQHVEEMGTMNLMFRMGDSLVTPALSGSILGGITRDSLLTLAQERGLSIEERPVAVEEVKKALELGILKEAFGSGTAAVVSPIRNIGIDGEDFSVPVKENAWMFQLREALYDIQYGQTRDIHGWNDIVR